MFRGAHKSDEDKVMTKRQVAALLYGAIQMRRDKVRPCPWAFDALLLMYVLGLRREESTLLRYSHVGKRDVNGVIRSIMVPTLKKSRMENGKRVSLNALDALHEVPVLAHHDWIAKSFDPRTRSGKKALSEWLLPSSKPPGSHLTARMVDYAFREAGDRGGVPKVYSTHALRHTAATEIARALSLQGSGEAEVDAWVGKFLRHSHISVRGASEARVYIHLAPRSVAEWVPIIERGVLTLPSPLSPVGPSRYVAPQGRTPRSGR